MLVQQRRQLRVLRLDHARERTDVRGDDELGEIRLAAAGLDAAAADEGGDVRPSGEENIRSGEPTVYWRSCVYSSTETKPLKLRPPDAGGAILTTSGNAPGSETPEVRRLRKVGDNGSTSLALRPRLSAERPTTFSKRMVSVALVLPREMSAVATLPSISTL
jgi:hypothetical protein